MHTYTLLVFPFLCLNQQLFKHSKANIKVLYVSLMSMFWCLCFHYRWTVPCSRCATVRRRRPKRWKRNETQVAEQGPHPLLPPGRIPLMRVVSSAIRPQWMRWMQHLSSRGTWGKCVHCLCQRPFNHCCISLQDFAVQAACRNLCRKSSLSLTCTISDLGSRITSRNEHSSYLRRMSCVAWAEQEQRSKLLALRHRDVEIQQQNLIHECHAPKINKSWWSTQVLL